MKRYELAAAFAVALLTGCGTPAPAPVDAVGASAGTSGGGSVAFSSSGPAAEAPVEYWKLDAQKEE